MMTRISKVIRKNGGSASAVVLLFTVTLGLMAMAGALLIQREGNSIGRTFINMQGEYAAQGTLKYAVERFKQGDFSPYETISDFGGLTVYMDTVAVNDSSRADFIIEVTATDGDVEYIIDGLMKSGDIDKAGCVNGAVTDVWVYDEDGNKDPDYLPSGVEVPDMLISVLYAMAVTQLHVYDSTYPPSDYTAANGDYASGTFWFGTGVPNVTFVHGNMTVPSGVTAYGLFLVEGNVTIEGSGEIEGVVLQPNGTSECLLTNKNGEIKGGVISEGSVDGTKYTFLGFELAASKIRERHLYIEEANNYLINEVRLVDTEINPD